MSTLNIGTQCVQNQWRFFFYLVAILLLYEFPMIVLQQDLKQQSLAP